MTGYMQLLAALPRALEAARAHALPGREAATVNGAMWELHELLTQSEKPASARVLLFPHKGA